MTDHSASRGLTCIQCGQPLKVDADLACATCGASQRQSDASPTILGAPRSTDHAAQASWFDESGDEAYEIGRPFGAGRMHEWLIGEKFRRATTGIELQGARALVVCGGSGMDAHFLTLRGATVVSADISLGATSRAAIRAQRFGIDITPVVADATVLPFADGAFDVVLVHDGLHHLDAPLDALREMARVSSRFVSVSEPADAAITRFAVHVGAAEEIEDAGNTVRRLALRDVTQTLHDEGFDVKHASRYAMFYRHHPHTVSRLLSARACFPIGIGAFRLLNEFFGSYGNKLAVVAVRP